MSERTFAGKAKYFNEEFAHHSSYDGELVEIGEELFESEDLVDRLYKILLPLIVKGWKGQPNSRMDIDWIANPYANGLYLPCSKRCVLSGQVDLKNDGLPDFASLAGFLGDDPIFSCLKQMKPSRGVWSPPFSKVYGMLSMWPEKGEDWLQCHDTFIAVTASGSIVPCRDPRRVELIGGVSSKFAVFLQSAAVAINAWQDRKHLWSVETDENLVGKMRTPIKMGVSPEHIKSLYYARELPVTEEGRKRPILHWVRAHQRRVRSGIDVDVLKHLRGVEKFEMGGFSFEITNPTKRAEGQFNG